MCSMQNPKSAAKIHFNRGETYSQKGELNNAIEAFTSAIKLDSKYAEAYYSRGIAYGRKGLLDKSTEDLNTVLSLDPNYEHKNEIISALNAIDISTRGNSISVGLTIDLLLSNLLRTSKERWRCCDAYYAGEVAWSEDCQ